MKITDISIQNVLGIASVDIQLVQPVALFAGDNYAGKSSIREAVKAAFLGMPERVLKKKDFGQLVHDGNEAGSVVVDFEGGSAYFAAPKGDQEIKHDFTMSQWEPMALALPYCLDAEAFARASSDERRQLLFAITGASAKTADIVASLRKRGLNDKLIETVTPLLRSGFPAATKFAEERCRNAKSDWKAVTGETYGHVKAEGWAASVPEFDAGRVEQLQAKTEILKDKISAEQTKLGAAEQKLKAWLAHSENVEADHKAFAKLASLEAKLERDQDDLLKWQDQVKVLEGQAGTGPRVGEVHDLARAAFFLIGCVELDQFGAEPEFKDAQRALSTYEARHGAMDAQTDPEAAAKLPEAMKARDLMQRCVDNSKRDIDAAKAAGARLSATVEKGSEAEVESIETILTGYQDELRQVQSELQTLLADQRAADAAKANTDKAHGHHQAAQLWQIAIDALSPAGIPAEILGKALDPFNQTMIDLADTFGWPGVAIDTDMMVTAGGRAYALLSESEKWRTNTIIALALASLSGLRLVALDRVDVLNLAGRAELIDGLDALAEEGFFDTALLFGTFKKLPNFERFPHVTGFWVESGAIAQAEAIREAA
jgi:hypothetical protein